MAAIQAINFIAIDPSIRSGRPYIVDTTVTVADIVIAKIYHRQDVDGIAEWYALSLSQVHAALAYYYDHKDEMDEQVRELIRRADALAEKRVGNERSLLPAVT
jgi:uncharacterized protein (DUF433 family)